MVPTLDNNPLVTALMIGSYYLLSCLHVCFNQSFSRASSPLYLVPVYLVHFCCHFLLRSSASHLGYFTCSPQSLPKSISLILLKHVSDVLLLLEALSLCFKFKLLSLTLKVPYILACTHFLILFGEMFYDTLNSRAP